MKSLRLVQRAALRGAALARAAPRATAAPMAVAPLAFSSAARRSILAAPQLHRPPLVASAVSRRAFSTSDLLIRQADQTVTLLAKAEKLILHADEHHKWTHLDPEHLDEMVATVGRCRDFVNSLTEEECAAAEAHNKVISQTEFIEGMLETAIKCDEISATVHHIRMEIEDFGTEGDGDNHPGAFTKAWSDVVDKIFNDYAEMLETCDRRYVQRLENELGYELLLLKRVMHIDNFRYAFPKVHPSGFSASAD